MLAPLDHSVNMAPLKLAPWPVGSNNAQAIEPGWGVSQSGIVFPFFSTMLLHFFPLRKHETDKFLCIISVVESWYFSCNPTTERVNCFCIKNSGLMHLALGIGMLPFSIVFMSTLWT